MLLEDILTAVDLDIVYAEGFGDRLVTDQGREILDIVQGAGTGLFGHNHPEIVATITATLAARVPQQAQFSIRPSARRLVERLGTLLAGDPAGYVGVFTNSGTESTEAALKHALLEHHARLRSAVADGHRSVERISRPVPAMPEVDVPPELAGELGLDPRRRMCDAGEVMAAVGRRNESLANAAPRFMALRRSFHGKSLGALRVTFNERYRTPFLTESEAAIFVDPADPAALEAAFRAETARFYRLQTGAGGRLQVEAVDVSRIAGFVYEPIQGEAGIYPVPAETLQRAAALCREHDVPLIADEVQTFARTGELLASHALGIDPDYILLAKGLGGGICKIGLVLIRRDRYQLPFSHLHSSTFAGDELSSRVALKTLDMLTRADGALLANARQKGLRLLEQLRALQARHPEAIVDVRGRGLLIGVEFRPLTDLPSWGFRTVGQASGCPALDLSAYLVHETGVRTLPTLSQVNTIRIEPPLAVSDATLDRIVAAIGRLAQVLSSGDAAAFLRHKLNASAPMPSLVLGAPAADIAAMPDADCGGRRAAFICHAVDATELRTIDPSFTRLDKSELERLLRRYEGSIAPHILGQTVVRSITGARTGLVFIGIPYTSARLAEMLQQRNVRSARIKIQQAIDVAARLGCTVCGLGQYSSIVTHNGLAVGHERVALTTGNALTVGTAYAALLHQAQRRGCDAPEARVAVVGAAGNIGAVLAALMSDRFARIKLIGSGRWGSNIRLQQTAHRIFERAWRRRADRDEAPRRGLAAEPRMAALFKDATLPAGDVAPGERLYRAALARYGEAVPVTVHDDLAAIADCDLVVCAANTSEPIVRAEHLRAASAVVCDVGVPHNVDPEVRDACPDVDLIRGGAVTLPYGEDVQVLGNHLPSGQVFACVAETMLLALEGRSDHFSYGDISCDQVAEIQGIALRHGFALVDPLSAKALWAAPAPHDGVEASFPS